MKALLICVIVISGYFMILSAVLTHARSFMVRPHRRNQQSADRNARSVLAIVTLMIYAMGIVALLVLSSFAGKIGLALYMVLGVASFAFLLWRVSSKLHSKNSVRLHILIALIVYGFAVLCVTLFLREDGINSQVQMELLAWLDKSGESLQEAVRHMFLNIFLFVPFGALACMAEKDRKDQPLSAAMLSTLLSVCIETIQLMRHAGTCDIDDILANMLGGAIGSCCILMFSRANSGRERSAL